MKVIEVQVLPNLNRNGWMVRTRYSEASSETIFLNKTDALTAGKVIAKRNRVQLTVYDSSYNFEKTFNYSEKTRNRKRAKKDFKHLEKLRSWI